MRAFAAGLLLASLLLPGAASNSYLWPPENHSPHVQGFLWSPMSPARGEGLNAVVTLRDAGEVEAVVLRVCRVEGYACRAPLRMAPTGASSVDPSFSTPVSWEPAFYRGVRTVGLAVILQFRNGTTEESPRASWPGAVALPEGGGTYYFYTLPAEPAPSAGPTFGLVGVAFVLAAFLRRRP